MASVAVATVQTALPSAFDVAREHYPTPPGLARYAVECLLRDRGSRPVVLDPGAGTGVWGRAVRARWRRAVVVGVDLPGVPRVAGYNVWRCADFVAQASYWRARRVRFDFVVGNPPFSLAEAFIRSSYDLLKPGGQAVFLLRLAFLGGQARGAGLWRELPLREVRVSSRRPSFTANGVSDQKTEYALFVWQRDYQGATVLGVPFDYEQEHTWDSDVQQLGLWAGEARDGAREVET